MSCLACARRRVAPLLTRRSFISFQNVYQNLNRTHSVHATSQNDRFFITTPIFYVNAAPHIGHLYSCLVADAAARFYRLSGSEVFFSTGTDEHGLKIQQAAEHHELSPADFSRDVSETFRHMFDSYNISYDDFIRTTEDRHRNSVINFWKRLSERGYIYKGMYEGWYSVSDEAFLGTDDIKDIVDKDGNTIKVAVDSEQPVTWMQEENYMFRLSEFRQQLTDWLDTGAVQPSVFDPMVRKWVSDLPDLSVSRQRSRLQWGVPVPGDEESQTIYVWLDALVNYLTVGGYPHRGWAWPASCHVVGKDILKFHAVYWPAFLLAAGLDLPKKVFCHSHWLINNVKMSKSRGNIVDPMKMKEKYSADVFRYFLLREGVPHSDGNYNEEKGMEYVNADIVNTLGNLLSRCTGAAVNPEQVFPRKRQEEYVTKLTATDRETFESVDILIDTVEGHYKDLHFYRGIDSIMSYVRWANGLVQHHQPWVLARSPCQHDQAHLKTVVHIALETLRVSGILLQPVVPTLADRLLSRLGVPANKRTIQHARKPYLNSPEHLPLGENNGVLLKRFKYVP